MATHYFASHSGGIEIVADELFRGLALTGQEVVWIAGDCTLPPEPVGASHAIGLPVFNWFERVTGLPFPLPALGALNQIRRLVREADIVILHDCLYLTNIVTFLMARLSGVPTIIVQHVGEVPYRNSVLAALMKLANKTVTRGMLSRAQQVVFISETTKASFRGVRFRNPPEVIFNGVDTELFRCGGAEEKRALRRKYKLPEVGPVALFVGRFVEKKGIAILKLLAEQQRNFTWVFAGWGPLDPRHWNADNVRVFSGLRGTGIAELYRACDVLALPSVGEGFPLVVQEALASGLPVVCGADTQAADPETAPFVSGVPIRAGDYPGTAKEFLSAIEISIISAEQERSEERSAFAASRYCWGNAVEGYMRIASSLVPKRASQSKQVAMRERNSMEC